MTAVQQAMAINHSEGIGKEGKVWEMRCAKNGTDCTENSNAQIESLWMKNRD